MDNGPLVSEEIEAGAELIREFDRYAPVNAAFWMRLSEEDQRYLYISSEQISSGNFDQAYLEIGRIEKRFNNPSLDFMRIKVIYGNNPLLIAALEIYRRHPGRTAIRYGGRFLAGRSIDDLYLYPLPLSPHFPFACSVAVQNG